MRFAFRPLTPADVEALLAWHYEPPYETYDPGGTPEDAAEMRAAADSPTWFAVEDPDDGDLIAFVEYIPAEDEVEIGLGLRPDLTGRGIGQTFAQAVVDDARARWPTAHVWLDVFPWNDRAITVYERLGFVRGDVYLRRFEGGVEHNFLRMDLPDQAGEASSAR